MTRHIQDSGDRPARISRRALLFGAGATAIGVGVAWAAIAARRQPGSLYWPATAAPLGATSMAVMEGDLWVGNERHLMRWPVGGSYAEWEVADIAASVNAVACDSTTLVAGLGDSSSVGVTAEVLRINPLNGVQMWRFSTDLPVSAVALHGGSVLAGTSGVDRGKLLFLATGDGTQQAPPVEVDGGVTSVAATGHGWVVGGDHAHPDSAGSRGSLSVRDPSGSLLWRQTLPTQVVAVAAAADLVVSGSNTPGSGMLDAFDAATGARRWGPQDAGSPIGALAATGGTLIVGTQTHVQGLAIADGAVKWTFATPRQVFALATDGKFVFVSTGNSLLGLWL
jgi:outer membrane protein assembly factor BamB